MRPIPGATRSEAYANLFQKLCVAKQMYALGQENGRDGITLALGGVVEFLNSFIEMRDANLGFELMLLMQALGQLDEGIDSPLFRKKKREGKRASKPRKTMMGLAVATLDILMDSKIEKHTAAKQVAAVLQKSGVFNLGSRKSGISASTVLKWREKISEDVGAHTFAKKIYLSHRQTLRSQPKMSAERFRVYVLTALEDLVTAFRLRDENSTLP